MKKAKLRNEIEKVLDEVWGSMRYDSEEATDQILSLLEGSLPEDKVVEDLKGQIDYGYMQGWNACLEEIKEKLK